MKLEEGLILIMKNNQYGVTYYDPSKAYNGYTLFASMGCRDMWLINMQGQFVHRWTMPERPGSYGKLLPNGHLIYGCKLEPEKRKRAHSLKLSGYGGLIREVDWDNDLLWEYEDPFLHHDFCRMENGNTMVLKWVQIPKEIMLKVKGGVPGTEDKGKMWADQFNEVTPEGKVIWQWTSYEHFDPTEHSICPLCDRREWTHANTCVVFPNGDILTSFRNINTICIIDKTTGKIKWEWGRGLAELAHQHDPHLLENGNILIFDNGVHRAAAEVNCSIVMELNPKTKKIEWEYRGERLGDFYSSTCSGAQRLPNGNTLICSTTQARIFEITPKGEIVWEYINPFYGEIDVGIVNWVFKAYRYGPDYPGIKGNKFSIDELDSWNKIYG